MKKYSIKNQLLNEDAFAKPAPPESLTAKQQTQWQKFWNDILDQKPETVPKLPKLSGEKKDLFDTEFEKFKSFSNVKTNITDLNAIEQNYIDVVDPLFTPNELTAIKSKIESIAKDSLTEEEKNNFNSSLESLSSRKEEQLKVNLIRWYPGINDTNLKDMIDQSIEKRKATLHNAEIKNILKQLRALNSGKVTDAGFNNFAKVIFDLFDKNPTNIPRPNPNAKTLKKPKTNNKFWEALKELCAGIGMPIPMKHPTEKNIFRVDWSRLKSEVISTGQTPANMFDVDNAIANEAILEYEQQNGEWKPNNVFDFEKYDEAPIPSAPEFNNNPNVKGRLTSLNDTTTISRLQAVKTNNDSDIDIGPVSLQMPLDLINKFKDQLIQNFTNFINSNEPNAENTAYSFNTESKSDLQAAVLLKMMFTALQVKDSRSAGPLTERFAEIMTGGKGLNSGFQSNFIFADLLIGDNVFISVKYSKAGLSSNRMKRDAIAKINKERLYRKVRQDKPVYLGIIYMTSSGSTNTGNYVRISTGLCALEEKGGANSTINTFQNSLGNAEAEWGDKNLRESTNINDFYIYLPSNKKLIASMNKLSASMNKLSASMNVSINDFNSLYQDLFLYNKNIFDKPNSVLSYLKNDAIAIREKGRYTANIIGDYLIDHLEELDNPNVFKFWKDINNKIGASSLNENSFHSFSLKYLFEIKESFKTGKWSFRFTNFISRVLPPLDEIAGPNITANIDYNSIITSVPSKLSLKTRHLIFENILLYCLYYGSMDPNLGYTSEKMYDETENLTRTFLGGSNTNSSILLNDNSPFCDVAFFESAIPSFYSVKWNKDTKSNTSPASSFYRFSKDLSQTYLPDTITTEKKIRIGWVEWSLSPSSEPTIIIHISHEDVWLKNKRLYRDSELKKPITGEYKTKANQIECSIKLLNKNVMLECLKLLGVTPDPDLQETIRNIILNISTSVLGTSILASSEAKDSKTFSGSFESKIEKLVDNLNGQNAKPVRKELEIFFKKIKNVIDVLKAGDKNGLTIDDKYQAAKKELNKEELK